MYAPTTADTARTAAPSQRYARALVLLELERFNATSRPNARRMDELLQSLVTQVCAAAPEMPTGRTVLAIIRSLETAVQDLLDEAVCRSAPHYERDTLWINR